MTRDWPPKKFRVSKAEIRRESKWEPPPPKPKPVVVFLRREDETLNPLTTWMD